MLQVYSLEDKATKRLLLRMGLLLLVGVAMAAAVLFLGLERWTVNQYPLVNAALLLIGAVSASALVIMGGVLDGKKNKSFLSLVTLGVVAAAALVIWVVLAIAKTHESAALVIFLVCIALTVALCYKAFGMVKSFWQAIGSDSDKSGNKLQYPGDYMLSEVHTREALTSPMGKVLIKGHAVLFVVVNQYKGHVLVTPNGRLEIRKIKGLFENKSEEGSIDYSGMTYNGTCGARRMLDIVKSECERQGIAEPGMVYDYAVFLPNFQQGNYVFDEGNFKSTPWLERIGSYKEYLKKANTADYFSGRACFNTSQLEALLNKMNADYVSANPGVKGDARLVAETIAQVCELVPRQ